MDKSGFCALVTEYQSTLYRLALCIMRNPADAEDAVSEAVTAAWVRLGCLKKDSCFKAWLYRILVNTCRGGLRGSGRIVSMDDVAEPVSPQRDDSIWDAVEHLGEPHSSVLILFYYERLSVKEIGQVLGVSEGAVKTRLSRARDELRKELDNEF